MGLLDEAIREHLELKRRRGADPAEVAREQREALEPISAPAPAPESPEDTSDGALVDDLPTEEHALEPDAADADGGGAPGAERSVESPVSAAGADSAAPARPPREPEETAELDMSTVLDEPARDSEAS